MKLLTKEEEAAHYNATLQGGILGGVAGLAIGGLAVVGASRRYPHFNQLTLPLKAFLITSAGTFSGIISADHASRTFQTEQNPLDQQWETREKERRAAETSGMTFTERAMDFGRRERYKIVGASWVASMYAAFSIVNRNKFLTGPQKLVQARVYAQFLTLGVLVATAAFEISDSHNDEGKWETVRVTDPNDPEHKRMIEKKMIKEESQGDEMWRDMVAAEEERLKMRDRHQKKVEEQKEKEKEKKKPSKKSDKKKDDEE